jgi:hypothetical protein
VKVSTKTWLGDLEKRDHKTLMKVWKKEFPELVRGYTTERALAVRRRGRRGCSERTGAITTRSGHTDL